MPKGSYYKARGKGKRSKRKRQARRPIAPSPKQRTPIGIAPSTRLQPKAIEFTHVLPELKRIGIIAGALILLLIILSLVPWI